MTKNQLIIIGNFWSTRTQTSQKILKMMKTIILLFRTQKGPSYLNPVLLTLEVKNTTYVITRNRTVMMITDIEMTKKDYLTRKIRN